MAIQTYNVLRFDAGGDQVIRQLIAARLQLRVRVLLLACVRGEERRVRISQKFSTNSKI